ncbi:MAG TPA: MFS transporter [Lysobacter sp.]|nr:MFS transporter [Lysobacter sp.]
MRAVLALAAVVFAGVVAALQVGKVPVAAPLLHARLGLDVGQIGALSSAIALLGVLASLPAGGVTAALGERRVLATGLGVLLAGAVSGAIADAFAALLIARIVEGLGFLAVVVAGAALIERIAAARARALAYAGWSCAMPAGIALAMVIGPHFADWRTLAWASAALAAVALVAVVTAVRADRSGRRSEAGATAPALRAVLRRRRPQLLAVAFALYSLMFFALFSFLPFLLVQRLALDPVTAGTLSGLACAANLIGNLAAGVLRARFATATLIAAAAAIMAACALGIFLPLFGAWPTFALCVAFSAAGGLLPAAVLGSAADVSPTAAHVPVTMGLLMQGSNTGQALGPLAIGMLIAHAGWPAAGGAVVAAGLALLACGWSLRQSG